MQESDDIALLREYVEHDSGEAFATLVARHVDKVYSVALRHTGNPHAAEEIAQAVFVILARKARSLGKGVILSGWLYHAARLASLTFVRSEIRRSRREQEAYMQTLSNETESELWLQIAPLLDQAMAGLNEKDRHAIVLRFFDGHNVKEVGAALGTSEDAAKMRLSRAVEKLRSFFLKRGMAVPAAGLTDAISTNSVQSAPALLAQSAAALALAHGASVSASTLNLIQGVLKLMAWTKAKTVLAATAVALLVGGTGIGIAEIMHSARVAAYPDIQGTWQGFMHFDDDGVAAGATSGSRVVLKIVKAPNGYRATTDWIDLGRSDVPLGKVDYDFPSLKIEHNPRDTWKITVNGDATAMTLEHYIHFIQPDPVSFTRTVAPETAPEPLAESDFAPRTGSDLQGYWKGMVGKGRDAIPVRLKIAQQNDGSFRAEGDNPSRGANGMPVSVSYNPPLVKLTLATGGGMFQGQLNRDSTELSGVWIQGGQSIPAWAKRADYQAELAQEDGKDYTFTRDDELQGRWRGTWHIVYVKTPVDIRLALDIARLPDGTYVGAFSDIDQFGQDGFVPASELRYDPPNLHVKWSDRSFEGQLKGGKLIGKWHQGGGVTPLVFERGKAR